MFIQQASALLCLSLFSASALAQCEIDSFAGSDASSSFGNALALSEGRALVGASTFNDQAPGSGVAYFFEWDGEQLVEFTRVPAPLGVVSENFGRAVDLDGERAILGAGRGGGGFHGAAYTYVREPSGWVQEQQLFPNHAEVWSTYGDVVALEGDVAVVGSKGTGSAPGQFNDGYVFVFERAGGVWSEVARLEPEGGGARSYFGIDLALADGHLFVACTSHEEGPRSTPAVFRYERDGGQWSQVDRIPVSGGSSHGIQLATDGATLMIRMGDEVDVYSIADDSVARVTTLAKSLAGSQNWGRSLSVEGDRIAVGATHDGLTGGSPYVELFRSDDANWSFDSRIHGSTHHTGRELSIDGGALLTAGPTGYGAGSIRTLPDSAVLLGGASELSASMGEAQELDVILCPTYAGRAYRTYGTLSGTDGSFGLGGGLRVPFVPDRYTRLTATNPGYSLTGGLGTLDGNGEATVEFQLPGAIAAQWVGTTFHHAVVVLDPNGDAWKVTGAIAARIVP